MKKVLTILLGRRARLGAFGGTLWYLWKQVRSRRRSSTRRSRPAGRHRQEDGRDRLGRAAQGGRDQAAGLRHHREAPRRARRAGQARATCWRRIRIVPDMVTLAGAREPGQPRRDRARRRPARARPQPGACRRTWSPRLELRQSGHGPRSDAKRGAGRGARTTSSWCARAASRRSGTTTNTLVRATIDGMVLDVPVKDGNSVIETNTFNDGTTIATIADMRRADLRGQGRRVRGRQAPAGHGRCS